MIELSHFQLGIISAYFKPCRTGKNAPIRLAIVLRLTVANIAASIVKMPKGQWNSLATVATPAAHLKRPWNRCLQAYQVNEPPLRWRVSTAEIRGVRITYCASMAKTLGEAVEVFRKRGAKGGKKGSKARVVKLTPEMRREIARKAQATGRLLAGGKKTENVWKARTDRRNARAARYNELGYTIEFAIQEVRSKNGQAPFRDRQESPLKSIGPRGCAQQRRRKCFIETAPRERGRTLPVASPAPC